MATDSCRGVSFDAVSCVFINLDNIFWKGMNENDKNSSHDMRRLFNEDIEPTRNQMIKQNYVHNFFINSCIFTLNYS